MNVANIGLGIYNIMVGVICILISIPLVLRKIPMNSWYGIRFSNSFVSEQNWYRINAYGGKQLIVWSFLLILFGGGDFFSSHREKSNMDHPCSKCTLDSHYSSNHELHLLKKTISACSGAPKAGRPLMPNVMPR